MVQKRVFLTTADVSPWKVPYDWNPHNNSVSCRGGGACGSDSDGKGGGGGGFAEKYNLNLSGLIPFSIGYNGQYQAGEDGGDTDFNSGEIIARGGKSGANGGLGGGQASPFNVGTLTKKGGNGGAGGTNGGGGGGCAGAFSDGGDGGDDGGYGGVSGDSGGPTGGEGPPAFANGQNGTFYNGTHGSGSGGGSGPGSGTGTGGDFGAGGGGNPGGTPGDGAYGLIVITWEALPQNGFFAVM